MKTQHT